MEHRLKIELKADSVRLARHYVVWTTSAIFHPALCSHTPSKVRSAEDLTEDEGKVWRGVSELGLGGTTGTPISPKKSASYFSAGSEPAGLEMHGFVHRRWPGAVTLWFANPPSLQSVPGLAHFHVLVKE